MAWQHRVIRQNKPGDVEAAYGAALLLTLSSVVVTIAAGGQVFAPVIAGVLQGLTLVAVLLVSGARRSFAIVMLGAAALATLLATLFVFSIDAAFPAVPILWAFIVSSTIAAVLRNVTEFRVINMQAVLGLLTTYLLLGLLFAYIDMFAAALTGGFFTSGEMQAASFVYFSYVTIATVGYGDLTPIAGIPRALAVTEAIVGQLYLVSVVALAIGRFGFEREVPTEK